VLAKETVIPRQLIARARAVEPEGVDDDASTASLEHGAEQAHGAVAERLYADAMRAIADHRHREIVGAPRVRRERRLDRVGLVDAHAQSAAAWLRRGPQLEVPLRADERLRQRELAPAEPIVGSARVGGLARRTLDGNAGEAVAIDVTIARSDAQRAPRAAAAELTRRRAVCRPSAHRQDEAGPRIAITRLQRATHGAGERIGRRVRVPVERHARHALAARHACERRMKRRERPRIDALEMRTRLDVLRACPCCIEQGHGNREQQTKTTQHHPTLRAQPRPVHRAARGARRRACAHHFFCTPAMKSYG